MGRPRARGPGGDCRRGEAPDPAPAPRPAPAARTTAAATRWGDRSSTAAAGGRGRRTSSRTRRPWLPAPRRSSGSRANRVRIGCARAPGVRGATQKKRWRQSRTSSGPIARSLLTIATSTWPSADQPRGLERVRGRDLEAQRRPFREQTPQDGQQQRLAQVVAGGDPQRRRRARSPARPAAPRATSPRRTGGSGCRAPPRRPGCGRTPRPTFSNSAHAEVRLDRGGAAGRRPRRSCAGGGPPRRPSRSGRPPARREGPGSGRDP